jgi:hypothetical protein
MAAKGADLEVRVLELWNEANQMLQANLLDTRKAWVLQKRLRDYADMAHEAGYADRERLLRLAANSLAARFPLPPE